MAWQSGLGRWSRFVTSFDHIDAAIEAADPSVCRDEFRRLRMQIAMLFGDAEDDAGKMEELCVFLDGVMEESLATLQTVPADAVPKILASSAYLADAVGWLRSHDSARVRELAHDVIRGWKAAVQSDIVRMTAAIAKLDDVSPSKSRAPRLANGGNAPLSLMKKKEQPESKLCANKRVVAPVVGVDRVKTAEVSCPRKTARPARTPSMSSASSHVIHEGKIGSRPLNPEAKKYQAKIQENLPLIKKMGSTDVASGCVKASEVSPLPIPKKMTPVASAIKNGGRASAEKAQASTKVLSPEERMEATKRKLREGYQEAADAKRWRRIQLIDAPKMVEQQRKSSITRERNRVGFGNSTAARRSLLSSFQKV